MKKLLIVLCCSLTAVVLLTVGVWFYAIPDDYVVHQIERLNLRPLQVELDGFSKNLFFGFHADNLVVKNNGREVLGVSGIKGKLHPLNLLIGKVNMDITGIVYDGEVSATLILSKGKASAQVEASGVDVGSVGPLRDLGLKGEGKLSGNLFYEDNAGTLQCLVSDASFNGFSTGGIFVPMKYFHTLRCAVDILSPGNFSIRSVSLEGKGIFARVKGSIRKRDVDLGVELMPESGFEDSSLLMLLKQYKVSEGYYLIPLKTRIY